MSVSIIGRCSAQLLELQRLPMPLFLEKVSAGFPSPAQDYVEQTLDLNELCIKHPAATFFVRADGLSMIDAGIYPGDILVVDRSIRATHGDIIIASVDGELTVKELSLQPCIQLLPCNPDFSAIALSGESELEVFGVVTNVIHNLRHRNR